MRRSLLIAALALLLVAPALAQTPDPQPGDPCPVDGYVQRNGGPQTSGVGHTLICVSGAWQSAFTFDGDAQVTKIGDQTCNSGEVLKFDGAKWACAPDATGAGDNLGDHTATQDLDINGNDIIDAVDIYYTGLTVDQSDIRLKTDIHPLGVTLDRIAALEPISFRMKGNNKPVEYGFAAQDVQKIFPDLVVISDDADQTLSLNYVGLIAPMVQAIKELKAENEALHIAHHNELAALRADVAGLKAHTGYGINKAQIGAGMLGGALLSGALIVVWPRRRKQ